MTDLIVLQWNNSSYTVKCLKTLKKYTRDYRVIFIDNGSEESEFAAAYEILKTMPHQLIRNPTNLGFVKGVNQGLATSTSDIVGILNNDIELEPRWLEKLLMTFEEKPDIGIVGPTTVIADSWQNRDTLQKIWGDTLQGNREIEGMLAFFCVLISRDLIKKIGYLSEEYGMGFGDDDDYCEWAKEAGFKLYINLDVTIPHHHRTTMRNLPDWEQLKDDNLKHFKKKWFK